MSKEKPFHYWQSGLDYVYLYGGVEITTYDGTPFYKIQQIDNLHNLLANRIVNGTNPIRGMELRFLRTLMGLSQEALAKSLCRQRDTIAQAEAKPHTEIAAQMDRLLRFIFIFHNGIQKRGEKKLVERMNAIAEKSIQAELRMRFSKKHWNATDGDRVA